MKIIKTKVISKKTKVMEVTLRCNKKELKELVNLIKKQKRTKKCLIFGAGYDFEKYVSPKKIKKVCQKIWNKPQKYSAYGGESAYYDFLKFLWVKFPDGKEERLCNMVNDDD